MSENYTNIGSKTNKLTSGPADNGISKVVINVTEELQYIAGDDRGNTVTLQNPWGSQLMAENILKRLRGYTYQPYKATKALLDPASELGDGVSFTGLYGGIAERTSYFSPLFTADIGAPDSNEIDHEYPFKTPAERKLERRLAAINAEFSLQADKIAAKVSKTGGEAESFGWTLTEKGFILSSNSKEIFKANNTGIEISGKITALSGFIGNGKEGFTINSESIFHGMTSLIDTLHNGIYIGRDGISLGKGKFRVDAYGNLHAENGFFNGWVKANSIDVGGDSGYITGYQIGSGEVDSDNVDYYVGGGVDNGYYAYDRFNDNATANYIRVMTINPDGIVIGGRRYRMYVAGGVIHVQ